MKSKKYFLFMPILSQLRRISSFAQLRRIVNPTIPNISYYVFRR